jgi:6-hydroxycyclohex-1-ene-1-carbonyl-CoA dehydrogenase
VKPNHPLPLVLGHEVVGTVQVCDEESLVGARVLVPAVLPCGDCAFCRAGRGNACLGQKMPGNDIHGGFAKHLVVPAAPLVRVDELPSSVDPRTLGVIADAVSTAYQAVRRADLGHGDIAFVIGAGGVGGYVVQIARALGARVVACDVSPSRLEQIAAHGAEETVDVSGLAPKEVRAKLHGLAKSWALPSLRFRIFECSGTAAGQELAFTLLARAATLVFVGYTFDKVNVRLSNLMAFDATAHGTWGCPPEAYADVLRLLSAGDVVIHPFVDVAPMSSINDQLAAMAAHQLEKRMVLVPQPN